MQVDALMVSDESADFYNPDLRNVLETLLVTFRTSPRTTIQAVDPIQGTIYRADLFGFLTSLKISPCYHWFIMRLNQFFAPTEFNETVSSLLMPNQSDLKKIQQLWSTQQTIKT